MKIYVVLMIVAMATVGCNSSKAPEPPAKPKATQPATTATAPKKVRETAEEVEKTDTVKILATLENSIRFYEQRAKKDPSSWLELEKMAAAHMSQARLTGSYDAYVKAEDALKRAFERAKEGSGPALTRASLHATLHRFDAAKKDIDPYLTGKKRARKPAQRAQIQGMLGDFALQKGQLDDAGVAYQKAISEDPTSGHMVRMAHLYRFQGQYDTSQEWFEKAVKASRREGEFVEAWTLLQQGLLALEQADYTKADAFYTKANATFSGWFLIEEHQAEILFVTGKLDEAETLYRAILTRAPSPEFMDALADVLEAKKQGEEASKLRQQAGEAYRKQIKQFPEAAYGHALDHFLSGDDAAFALDLAQKNHGVRPSAEAKVKLAQALVKADREKEAGPLMEAVEKMGWATPEFHATAHWVWTRLGDNAKAERFGKKAKAVDAGVVDDLAWMTPKKP